LNLPFFNKSILGNFNKRNANESSNKNENVAEKENNDKNENLHNDLSEIMSINSCSSIPINTHDTVDLYGMTSQLKSLIEAKYTIIRFLSKGSYGYVTKAKCKVSGQLVALKVMKARENGEYHFIKIIREVQLLRRFNEVYHIAN